MATKSAAIIVTTPRIFHEWLLVSWEGELLLPLDKATEVSGPFGCEQFYTKWSCSYLNFSVSVNYLWPGRLI